MSAAVESVTAAVRASDLLDARRPALVLLSGGRDSVCLLDVSSRVRGPGGLSALHVNYGLREAADEDERHCRALCEALGVPLDVARPPSRPENNVQAWARDVRYALAEERAMAGDGLVAVGHTASDQAETVLYRLAASPGRRALLGMRPQVGRVVRPLLAVTREQTAAYCSARGLAWRDDETNDGDLYARGRVRGALLPALRSLHPAAEHNVVRTAALLRDEAEALDGLVARELGSGAEIEVRRLRAMPRGLARLVVRELAERAAGRPAPAAAQRLDELLELAARRSQAALDLEGEVRAVIRHGRLSFTARADRPRWRSWRTRRQER